MNEEQIHQEAMAAMQGSIQNAQTTPMDPQVRVKAIAITEHIIAALDFYKAHKGGFGS